MPRKALQTSDTGHLTICQNELILQCKDNLNNRKNWKQNSLICKYDILVYKDLMIFVAIFKKCMLRSQIKLTLAPVVHLLDYNSDPVLQQCFQNIQSAIFVPVMILSL